MLLACASLSWQFSVGEKVLKALVCASYDGLKQECKITHVFCLKTYSYQRLEEGVLVYCIYHH